MLNARRAIVPRIQQANKGDLALWLGGLGLLVGLLLQLAIPQQPDGDATALAHFLARHGDAPLYRLRHQLAFNLAGALAAWGALVRLLAARGAARRLVWAGLLVAWSGWAWNQSRGWQGELFLEPGVTLPLGVDRAPTVRFERFLVPPAPDGPGRALRLALWVDGGRHTLAEATPYRGQGWTLLPHWYGATVLGPDLAAPLHFGASGSQTGSLRDGRPFSVTLNVEALTLHSEPPGLALQAQHHAILRARFAPGEPLLWLGGLLALGGLLLISGQKAVLYWQPS